MLSVFDRLLPFLLYLGLFGGCTDCFLTGSSCLASPHKKLSGFGPPSAGRCPLADLLRQDTLDGKALVPYQCVLLRQQWEAVSHLAANECFVDLMAYGQYMAGI